MLTAKCTLEYFPVSCGDLEKFLEEQILGVRVKSDFLAWTGFRNDLNYVRMRVAIRYEDFVSTKDLADDYASRFLRENNKGYKLDEGLFKAIKPFMYPENFSWDTLPREDAYRLNALGVSGENFNELVRNSRMTLVTEPETGKKFFRLYLRPEALVVAYVATAPSASTNSYTQIQAVRGTPDNYIWDTYRVTGDSDSFGDFNSDRNISLDKVFAVNGGA